MSTVFTAPVQRCALLGAATESRGFDKTTRDDTEFMLSPGAASRLHDEAKALGVGVARAFRDKAYRLKRDGAPTFDLRGQDLTVRRSFGINLHVLESIRGIVKRMGLPEAVVGELIATYVDKVPH